MTSTESISVAKAAPHIIALRPTVAQVEAAHAVVTPAGAKVQQAQLAAPQSLVDPKTALAAQENASTCETGCLTKEEELRLRDLKHRDAEVRRHEQAHSRAGGQYAGAPHFQYERGPDGRNYAVGGHVAIDVAPVNGDPQATIRKMATVQRAANAPADPSSQDRAVAAKAQQEKLKAQRELASAPEDETAANRPAAPGTQVQSSDNQPDNKAGSVGAYGKNNVGRVQSLITLVA